MPRYIQTPSDRVCISVDSVEVGGGRAVHSQCGETLGHVRVSEAIHPSVYSASAPAAMTLEIIELGGKQIQMTLLRHSRPRPKDAPHPAMPPEGVEHVCDTTNLLQSALGQ